MLVLHCIPALYHDGIKSSNRRCIKYSQSTHLAFNSKHSYFLAKKRTKGHLFLSDITCLLMSDLILQLMSMTRNSRLCFGDYFIWKKDKSLSLYCGCFPPIWCSSVDGLIAEYLLHNTYCGLKHFGAR